MAGTSSKGQPAWTKLTAASIVNYFGLRYAQAPVGELRWRPPMEIDRHGGYNTTDVMDATTQGPICVQGVPFWRPEDVPEGDEDCLLLDVLSPAAPAKENLPVLVQIHGGGYDQGSSRSNPGYLMINQSNDNLVYVAIQYRLGAFGFLSSAEIRENGAANAGLLDQRAALQWVQRNIRAFGGDPSKVTIIGGSAGGGSVMDQMIMYGGVSSPPFKAAIAEYPVRLTTNIVERTVADNAAVVAELQKQHRTRSPISPDADSDQLYRPVLFASTRYSDPHRCYAVYV